VLRSADSAGQALLAGRYFAHAEDLIQRGAADLAAPLYRQAYELLHASQASRTTAKQTVVDPLNEVIDLSPADLAAPSSTGHSPGASEDLEGKLQQLRNNLSADTADQVAFELANLKQQGLEHPDRDHLQGVVHILKGDSQAAAEHFRMAIAKDQGHYRSLVNLAGLVLAEGRLEEAQALLQNALTQVNPDSEQAVPALTNLSLVHQAAGRLMDEALLVLRVHRIKPGHLRAERLLQAAGILESMAEEPGAIEILQWLSDHNGGREVWMPLATLLERRGDYQAAALVYRRLLQPHEPVSAGQQS